MIIKSNDDTIYQRVLGAITNMSRNPSDAVFAITLISIPIVIDAKNDKIENQAEIFTDGRGIKITGSSKEIISVLNTFSTEKILKHELEHMLLNHIRRASDLLAFHKDIPKEYLMELINIAQDYIINKDIGLDMSYGGRDKIGIINDEYMEKAFGFKPEDLEKKSFEEIVEMIIQKKAKTIDEMKKMIEELKELIKEGFFSYNNIVKHMKEGNEKDFDDFVKKNTQKFGGDFKKYLTDVIKEAITSYGTGQSGVWKQLEDIYGKPVLDWKAILYNELKSYKTHEIDEKGINVVNRRYYVLSQINKNIPIMFQKEKRTFEDGLIAIDTSGSIDDKEYLSEIREIINLIKEEGGIWKILLFDDGIVKDKNGNPIVFSTAGKSIRELYETLSKRTYGGTDIKEVLDYANANRIKFLVLISDMEFNYTLPKYNTFRKVFISTQTRSNTPSEVENIADVIAYMG